MASYQFTNGRFNYFCDAFSGGDLKVYDVFRLSRFILAYGGCLILACSDSTTGYKSASLLVVTFFAFLTTIVCVVVLIVRDFVGTIYRHGYDAA